MGDLTRVEDEYDHQTAPWLRERPGEQVPNEVVLRMDVRGRPHTSEVCRTLGLTPPPHKRATPHVRPLNRVTGEAYLVTIHGILGGEHTAA